MLVVMISEVYMLIARLNIDLHDFYIMPFAPSICFERVSYIFVSTQYLSNVACNGQEVKSVVVSRGVCYCTEFDLVSSFFAPRLPVIFAIIGMLHGFLCVKKGLNFSSFSL